MFIFKIFIDLTSAHRGDRELNVYTVNTVRAGKSNHLIIKKPKVINKKVKYFDIRKNKSW